MTKEVDKRIDEGVLRWFGHVERMENDRIAKRVFVGECAGSRSVGRPRKRWVDIVKNCLKKRDLDVKRAKRRDLDFTIENPEMKRKRKLVIIIIIKYTTLRSKTYHKN